jgi:hypothetical protein
MECLPVGDANAEFDERRPKPSKGIICGANQMRANRHREAREMKELSEVVRES